MGKREYEILAILSIIILQIVLGYSILPSLMGSSGYMYVFRPLFWLALSVYVLVRPRCRFKGKLKLNRLFILWSAICGLLYISLYFSGGFLDGIGYSPYSKKALGVITNLLSFGSTVLMMEWVRNYLINRVKKKYIALFSIATVLIFSAHNLNLRMALNLESLPQAVQYLGEYAIPEIMSNILLTYMAYIGGASPAMVYSAVTSFPMWITPVLPDLEWITKAFIGIIMPVIFLLVIRQLYRRKSREIKYREFKYENPRSWIGVSIFSILLIWFAIGIFPVFPTVVLTGSMEPAIYPGDVALMVKTDGKNIKVGDVIQYWTGEVFIIHRVIDIDEATGRYQTKGDNNSSPDSRLVSPGQVKGKLLKVIPKLGLPAVMFNNSNRNRIREQAEF